MSVGAIRQKRLEDLRINGQFPLLVPFPPQIGVAAVADDADEPGFRLHDRTPRADKCQECILEEVLGIGRRNLEGAEQSGDPVTDGSKEACEVRIIGPGRGGR